MFDTNRGKSHPVLHFKRFKNHHLIPEVDYFYYSYYSTIYT